MDEGRASRWVNHVLHEKLQMHISATSVDARGNRMYEKSYKSEHDSSKTI